MGFWNASRVVVGFPLGFWIGTAALAWLIFGDLVMSLPGPSSSSRLLIKKDVGKEFTDFEKTYSATKVKAAGGLLRPQQVEPLTAIKPLNPDESVYPGQQQYTKQALAFAKEQKKTYYLDAWTPKWLKGYFGPDPNGDHVPQMKALLAALAIRSSGAFFVVGDPGDDPHKFGSTTNLDTIAFWNDLNPLLQTNRAVTDVVFVDAHDFTSLTTLWTRGSDGNVELKWLKHSSGVASERQNDSEIAETNEEEQREAMNGQDADLTEIS